MSSADTSYNLTQNQNFATNPQNILSTVPVYKYLDIDSTYRNRNNYSNPNNFVIPITYPGRDSTAATAVDPVIDAIPYSGSTDPPGTNQTQVSADASNITLDPQESDIDNFYINSVLEISGEFRTITAYNGTTFVATVNPAFSSTPPAASVYYTRKIQPFFVGTIAAAPAPTNTSFALNVAASTITGIYVNSYIRFTSGANSGLVYRIVSYNGSNRLVTISGIMPNIPTAGTTIELDSFSRDNASTLLYSGVGTSVQSSYYEIELLWLSVPNQVLGVGYGGTLDRYPYLYVRLYNEGNRLSNQVMFSNNPNSTLAMFKIPVDEYFGNTSFITLTNAKTKQIVRFDASSDIRFVVTLPDGTIVEYANADNLSPSSPDPFLQVNALFALRKV
jgi:hypothetical protein